PPSRGSASPAIPPHRVARSRPNVQGARAEETSGSPATAAAGRPAGGRRPPGPSADRREARLWPRRVGGSPPERSVEGGSADCSDDRADPLGEQLEVGTLDDV